MVDLLLVHDAGQGSWCWGRVWGHLTAPIEHPPRLYSRERVGKVAAMDLPGHGPGARQDTSSLTLDDFVAAVTDEVRSQGLHDLVMAGHGVTASILLQAAAKLEEPPKRIVLFAGIIPDEGKNALAMLSRLNRLGFKTMARSNVIGKKELRLPKAVITNVYCNGMDPFDVIQIVGRFSPLPLQLFQTRASVNNFGRTCPVTYVPLWRDRLFPPEMQRQAAERLGGVDILAELDSCHEVMIERPKQVADILLRYI